jgi:hypothetical protein
LEKKRPKRPPLVSEASTRRERSEGTCVIEKLLRVVHPKEPRESARKREAKRGPRVIGCSAP